MKYIKLTYPDGSFVYVNAENIVMMDNDGNNGQKDEMTRVYFPVKSSNDVMRWIRVKESPEEIIEMATKD